MHCTYPLAKFLLCRVCFVLICMFMALQIFDSLTKSVNIPIDDNDIISLKQNCIDELVFQDDYNIFFVETRPDKQILTLREACSLESAARHHPEHLITLYNINGDFNENHPTTVNLLQHYTNIRIAPLNVTELMQGTPLEQWERTEQINNSQYPVEHLSDAVRIALLWKVGGIYLDTDTIVINPMNKLKNAVGLESDTVAATGVMIFPQLSPLIYHYMSVFNMRYNGSDWASQGPKMMSWILQSRAWCNRRTLIAAENKPWACKGVHLLPRHKFYPVKWNQWWKLFNQSRELTLAIDFSESYAVHVFGSHSRNMESKVGNGSFLEPLFMFNCPKTYHMMRLQNRI